MVAVSIFEGGTEHRFDVPAGYKPIVKQGHGELVVDPDSRLEQRQLPGMSNEAQMGQRALEFAEFDMGDIGQ